jgi:DUF2911 family protein
LLFASRWWNLLIRSRIHLALPERPSPTLEARHVFGRRLFVSALAATICIAPTAIAAQGYPFSQRGSVSQTVAFTTITVTYGRPVARGRALFGQLVPWDSVWHPGADSATRIVLDHDVVLEGHAVKAGEYSMWLIPRERGAWTFILSNAAHTFHKPYPGAEHDVLRTEVTPERSSHMETLAIYFPVVLRDQATMRIHWGETAVPIRLSAPFRPD